MKSRTVLLQWIGHSDLRAMAATLPDAKRRPLLNRIGGDASLAGDKGPTKTLLTTPEFDEVRLLSNSPQAWNQWSLKWLDAKSATVIPVELLKPTDDVAIDRIADAELSQLRQRATGSHTELCWHLSPGTPAMAAVWLLLGKTRYPAKRFDLAARRERHGPRDVRPRHPSGQPPSRPTVPGDQLRRAVADPLGIGTLRTCQRSLHRSRS